MSFRQPIVPVSQAREPYFLGVDIGGTNIKIGLLDDLGKTLAYESIDSQADQPADLACERIARTCQDLAQRADVDFARIAGCGVGAPGPLSLRRGMLLTPTNLPNWHNFPIREAIEQRLDLPVVFINDANAAAFGEFWIGCGTSYESLALLTLGTGVGGGLINEGHLINGVNSFGSELGHIVVDCRSDARLCSWGGGQGQLEAYASASAVALRAQELVRSGQPTQLRQLGDTNEITAKDVHEAAVAGDEVALKIVDETAFYLGIGVTCTVHAIDPGLVVLGGAMNFGGGNCKVGQRFLRGVSEEFKRRTFPNVFDGTRIDFATLGGDAGYVGAAGIAKQQIAPSHKT